MKGPNALQYRPQEMQIEERLLASPILAALHDVHRTYHQDDSGSVATYIPELARADPSLFGISLATADGHIYEVGDSRHPFTIQSISKPFVHALALADHGRSFVHSKVGVEPTGDAFNSIVFDERSNRPFNPMVNAGAIATAALIRGNGLEERLSRVVAFFSDFAGRRLEIDEAVFLSEKETGHRNRAIAWLERNFGMIDERIDEHLDLYFNQCSILVTARDLALMAATLANSGFNPLTGDRVLAAEHVRDVLSVMHSCGMYDYTGAWSFSVGLPAKSGVGGGIIAVLPGQFGIGTFSPPLDDRGNSCRGIKVCEELSERFNLHVFAVQPSPLAVVRQRYQADSVRSKRLRSPAERAVLDRFGAGVTVYELQGDLYFAAMERLLRDLEADLEGLCYLILDGKRVGRIDGSARRLLSLMREMLASSGKRLLLAGFPPFVEELLQAPADEAWPEDSSFADVDRALEWCENRLIAAHIPATGKKAGPMPFEALDLVARLTEAELSALAAITEEARYQAGELIIREGEAADCLYILGAGGVSVQLVLDGGKRTKRLAAFAPGVCFGETALYEGGIRSADVVADEPSFCYRLPTERLNALVEDFPDIRGKLLFNLGRELSARLCAATAEIRALEG